MAKVIHIFISDDTILASNHRPILLLISLRKIIEKKVCLQINSFLICNALLPENQYGFRSELSIDNAINDMLHKVYDALDRQEYALYVMIDLSKAFHTLNRSTLLRKKLAFYGIQGKPLKWFDSYFLMREQLVGKDLLKLGCMSMI